MRITWDTFGKMFVFCYIGLICTSHGLHICYRRPDVFWISQHECLPVGPLRCLLIIWHIPSPFLDIGPPTPRFKTHWQLLLPWDVTSRRRTQSLHSSVKLSSPHSACRIGLRYNFYFIRFDERNYVSRLQERRERLLTRLFLSLVSLFSILFKRRIREHRGSRWSDMHGC